MILPDSRFEMPALFTPGRKPVGKVQIDWSHPFAPKGVKGAYILYGEGGPVNLIGDTTVTSTATGGVRGTGNGQGTYYTANADNAVAKIAPRPSGSGGFTVISQFQNNAVYGADGRWLVSFGVGGSNGFQLRYHGAGGYSGTGQSPNLRLAVVTYGVAEYVATTDFAAAGNDGIVYTVAAIYKANNEVVLLTNRGYRETISVGGYNVTSETTANVPNIATGTLNRAEPNILMSYFIDKPLPESQVLSLIRDPYQFLIPA